METRLLSLGFKESVIDNFLEVHPEFSLESPSEKEVHKAAKNIVRSGYIARKDVERYEDMDSFLCDLIDIGFRQEYVAEKMGHIEYSECLAHRGPYHVALDMLDNGMTEVFGHNSLSW
nr:hypothetical protein MarFTME_044 [Marseillevirus futianmevirus]